MRRNQRGSIIVSMIAALVIIDLIVVAVVIGGARDHDLTARRVETVQAYYAAESGLNMAMREALIDSDEDGDCRTGSISYDGIVGNDPAIGVGQFMVTASVSGNQVTLRSHGRSGTARRQISMVFQLAENNITFDNATPDSSSTARGSASFTHTMGVSSSDSILVVITITRGDQGTSGVDYGGVPMTPRLSEQAPDGGSGLNAAEWVQIFYLVNPPTGDNTVDVTFNNSRDPTAVAAISYFGIDAGDPIGAVSSASSSSSSSTVSTVINTTVDNSVVVGGLGHHGGDTYPHTKGGDVSNERFNLQTGTATGGDSGDAGGDIFTTSFGPYTFEWTGSASDDYAIACIELKPAP